MRRAALVLLLAALACERVQQAPPAQQQPAPAKPRAARRVSLSPLTVDPERDNLLSLAHGAVAIGRTAEGTYENSAVHAIDGTAQTFWSSPPEGPVQSLVYALPAMTRLTQLGVIVAAGGAMPEKVQFDVSRDGKAWTPIGAMKVAMQTEPQQHPVHADARFVRVTTLAPATQAVTVLQSVLAEGQELEPAAPASIDGCWSLDGVPARFAQHDAHVQGIILAPERPILLEGGTNGRVNLLMWLEAPMWGHATITVSRDGQHLSGIKWHETVIWDHAGDGWIGVRVPCTEGAFLGAGIAGKLLERAGHYTLFGLRFDDQDRVIADASKTTLDRLAQLVAAQPTRRFRLTSRELRKANAADNEAATRRRIDALRAALVARGVDVSRITFTAAGSDAGDRSTFTELEKVVVGAVELSFD